MAPRRRHVQKMRSAAQVAGDGATSRLRVLHTDKRDRQSTAPRKFHSPGNRPARAAGLGALLARLEGIMLLANRRL
jgi:hypothetical protein